MNRHQIESLERSIQLAKLDGRTGLPPCSHREHNVACGRVWLGEAVMRSPSTEQQRLVEVKLYADLAAGFRRSEPSGCRNRSE